MDDRTFRISTHAFNRMSTRNISRAKMAEIICCGQVYSQGNGHHRAKLYERAGKSEICYEAVFSKIDRAIISVWSTVRPAMNRNEENGKTYTKIKVYKQRKRALKEQEFDSWCREEYNNYSLLFTA